MDVLTSVLTTTNESAPGRLASGELAKLCAKVTIFFGIAFSIAAIISGLSLLVKESVPLNRLDAGAYFFVEMTFSSWFFRWYH